MAINRSKIDKQLKNSSKKKKKNVEVAGLGKWIKENLGSRGLKYHSYKLPGMANEVLRHLPLELMKKGGKINKKRSKKKPRGWGKARYN
jgi:hypothetical protein